MNEGYIIAIRLVYLCGIPLPERVRADAVIAQIITDDFQLLLDGSLADGEKKVGGLDAITQGIVFRILLNDKGNSKDTLFPCLLLHDGKPVGGVRCQAAA